MRVIHTHQRKLENTELYEEVEKKKAANIFYISSFFSKDTHTTHTYTLSQFFKEQTWDLSFVD